MPRKRTATAAQEQQPSMPGGPMPFAEYGESGIGSYGGRLNEEFVAELKGDRGRRVLREMAWNDPIIAAGLFVIRMLIRQAPISVEPGGTSPQDQLAFDLVDTSRDDMSLTWADTLSDICSMFVFGWAFLEVVYKHREGPWEVDGARRSQYADGLIGWRKWALRSQLSLDRWEIDAAGGVQAMVQRATLSDATRRREQPKAPGATGMGLVIPIGKALLFKTDNAGGSPEGHSILRGAYRPYYFAKRIEMLEGIGIERDMAGMPEIKIPAKYLMSNASVEDKAIGEAYRKMGENIRNDRMSCVVLPSDRDAHGNALYEFNLKGANGRRQFDTNVVLGRYAAQKAMVMLTDFILLGHEKAGSWALSTNKTELFGVALGAWRDSILAVINRHGIPALLAINGIRVEKPPRFVGGEIVAPSLGEMAKLIGELSGAGMPIFPDDEVENAVRRRLGWPAKEADAAAVPDETDPEAVTGKRARRVRAKVGSSRWAAEIEGLLGEKFDESQHRRHPKGVAEGGRFAPKDGGTEPGNQTDTPAFKHWFGKSKVVGPDGEPLVVYHGTPSPGFHAFDLSHSGKNTGSPDAFHAFSFTSNPETADTYSRAHEYAGFLHATRVLGREPGVKPTGTPATYPVFLSIQHPVLIKNPHRYVTPLMIKRAQAKGHDGIIRIYNPATGEKEYTVFSPSQIKSAIGNRGTFNPGDADITKRAEDAQ